MLPTLILTAIAAGPALLGPASSSAPTTGDEFPFLTAADRFRERYELADDPATVAMEDLLRTHYARVQLGVFELWMSARELEEKSTADDLKDLATALLESQAIWLSWIDPVAGDTSQQEKDLAVLRGWVNSWRPSNIAKEVKAGALDLMQDPKIKPKVLEAAERFARSIGRGEAIGLDRPNPLKVPLILVEDRAEFVEFVCFVGWLRPEFQPFYWKSDVGNWTEFFIDKYKVIALQYPVSGDKTERYDGGTSMDEKTSTGMQQQVVQLAMGGFLDETFAGTAPAELINGLAINLVIEQFGEANTRVDGALKERETSGYSVFVPGGQSEGGVLPGFSAESRWREDGGTDHFVRVLRQSQKDGCSETKRPEDRVSYFRLEDENRIEETVIRGPFYGAAAVEFQPPAAAFLDDYAEFMRAYRCAFVHWLMEECARSKKVSAEKFATLLRDMAYAEGASGFAGMIETIFERPISAKPVGKNSLEGEFLHWLSKQ